MTLLRIELLNSFTPAYINVDQIVAVQAVSDQVTVISMSDGVSVQVAKAEGLVRRHLERLDVKFSAL